MKTIQLLPLGKISPALLAELREGLAREYSVPCETLPPEPEPAYAFSAGRQQYSSTEILAKLAAHPGLDGAKVLGVVSADLFIPILTFVFGEAQLRGSCAVISTFRLRQEFYGLPADEDLLARRTIKEAVHELGHTLGIPHCEDYNCVMAPSHAVEWIDLKKASFCEACRAVVAAR
ncbi:MAG TPA: archaemetzincin [Candidatus Limnocylindrales bacterium]|nr:archaemetzincin [Candidatus Limnocylindrales bacterium]